MNSSQWEKLRKNLTLLQREVDADEILPFLIEKDVLEWDCNNEFDKICSNKKKIDYLLQKLKSAPQEKDAYRYFLQGLRSSGFDFYIKLADDIDATETESDPSVHAKVDSSHYTERVCKVLNDCFTNKRERITTLPQVKSVLDSNKVFGLTPWPDEEITDFVCKLFAGVEVIRKQEFLSTSTNIFFKHLGSIDRNEQSQFTHADPENTDQDLDISSLSPSELRSFLTKQLEKEKLSTNSLLNIEKEEITGDILLDMSEKDLLTVMPSSTFGQRRKIKQIVDRYKLESACHENRLERFRPFKSKPKPIDCYIKGSIVDTKIQTRGTKLFPIRNFHLPDNRSDHEIMQYIVVNCAIFAAACINERRNGTIYFGISPDGTGGRVKGQIEGLDVTLDDLDSHILSLFFSSQKHLVNNAVTNAQYIPVVKDMKYSVPPSNTHHVIEFDVVPNSLEDDNYVKIDAKDLPDALENYKSVEPVFVFSESGEPKLLPPSETCSNSKVPPSTIKQRSLDESEKLNPPGPDCLLRLRNHLTGGSNKIEDDVYKVLLLSSIDNSSIDLNNFDFVQNIQPEVVFDFDPKGYHEGIFHALEDQEEVLKVVTLNDFDESRGMKNIKSLKAELTESTHINWVFCNGYQDVEQVEAIQWNKKRRSSFRKAFNHYLENSQKNRWLIVICLFSHNDILVEACDEILIDLPDQWVLLSEQLTDAEMWQETIKNRNKVDRDDLKRRCIIGLPWDQVNNGISTWCIREDNDFECQIPHSRGTVKVEKIKLNEWNNVEVLSSLDPCFPDDKSFRTKEKEVEEDFYCGQQVQWLNFFSQHVCRRTIHEELLNLVSGALEDKSFDGENKVLPVYLFHEPGAGGSTSAREILWCLRKKYRSCVIKRFTDQTVDQLIEIFSFKEGSCPKPLLILIDNVEEALFRVSLEEKLRKVDFNCDIFCVLLICFRTVFVPFEKRKLSMVTLKQYLNKEEHLWFERKYASLTDRYSNPKSLISFNILKANFKKSYIEKTVRDFVQDIRKENENVILKLVSLINTFDLGFKAIHVSCFDVILKSQGSFSSRSAFSTGGDSGRKTNWEANVSQSFKVLLNLNDENNKSRKTVRVFNKLTAEHILNAIIERSGESESELILSLLTDDVFGENGKEIVFLQNIIGNVIKKRAFQEDSAKKDTFSPLILSVMKKEGKDKVIEILKNLFELTDDAFTAQQLSRFYIECKEFKEAEIYAEKATRLLPRNSSLMNTYAQVFKAQLFDKVKAKTSQSKQKFTESEFKELIALCNKSICFFKKEQSMVEFGSFSNDETGYFGELESVELILKAFQNCRCFQSKSVAVNITHEYLVYDRYTNERLEFLSPKEKEFLKKLWMDSKKAMNILDNKYLQMKEEIVVDPLSNVIARKKYLIGFKTSLNEFFGENCDKVPPSLNEEDACRYRLRMVFSKGASSLSEILHLQRCMKVDVLKECYTLLHTNIQSEYASLDDFKTIIDIATVLLSEGRIPDGLKFVDIIKWTKHFYQNSWKEKKTPDLEAFMYYFMYNFPTEERLKFLNLSPAQDLKSVLESWTEAFKKCKRWLHTITHRDTTLFFLGKEKPLQDIVYQQKLQAFIVDDKSTFIWDSPRLCNILRPMQGILMAGGDFITYMDTRNGTNYELKIKTSRKISNDVLWRKKIYFYLGFSFSGLKAYGMTKTKPMPV